MKQLINLLNNTDQAMWNYIWKASLISLIPTAILAFIALLVLPGKAPSHDESVFSLIFGNLIGAPWIETLVMWPILWVLKELMHRMILVAFVSSVIWGILHSFSTPAKGLAIWWLFFVLSICFLEWEKKSTSKAIVTTALVHTCHNLVPTIGMIITP